MENQRILQGRIELKCKALQFPGSSKAEDCFRAEELLYRIGNPG